MNASLFLLGLRHLLQGRTGVAAIALCIVPLLAGAILFVRDLLLVTDCPCFWDAGIASLVAGLVLGVTVPLTALLLASGVVSDEIDDGTISFLVTRPVSRRRIYFMRILPVLALATMIAVAQVLILGLGRYLAYVFIALPAEATVSWEASSIASGALAAALQVMLLCSVLSAINLYAPRWRFTLGLLYLAAWELPAGLSGGAGLGFLTGYFHALSIVDASTVAQLTNGASPLWVSVPWLVGWTALWALVASTIFDRRSIRVPNAA